MQTQGSDPLAWGGIGGDALEGGERDSPRPGQGGPQEEKKSVPERQFCKKTACSSYVQPWLVAVGGWRLVAIAGWRLAVGGWRLVAAGGWRRLAVGGWWRFAVGGGWWLAVGGPLGRSFRAVFNRKKKFEPQKDPSAPERPAYAQPLSP